MRGDPESAGVLLAYVSDADPVVRAAVVDSLTRLPATPEIVPGWVEEPTVTRARVSGVIITVDSFGNLYTNIDGRHVRPLRNPVVRLAGRQVPVRRTYADVKPGEYVALINSFGVLEIARAERRAADELGVGRGAPVTVHETG